MNKKYLAIIASGLGLFVFVAAKMGASGIMGELKTVGMALPILAAISSSRLVLQTMAWSSALTANGVHASAGELMGARASAQLRVLHGEVKPVDAEPQRGVRSARDSARTRDYRHPYCWAPFFLMGNWL